jgi:hypothetical protein
MPARSIHVRFSPHLVTVCLYDAPYLRLYCSSACTNTAIQPCLLPCNPPVLPSWPFRVFSQSSCQEVWRSDTRGAIFIVFQVVCYRAVCLRLHSNRSAIHKIAQLLPLAPLLILCGSTSHVSSESRLLRWLYLSPDYAIAPITNDYSHDPDKHDILSTSFCRILTTVGTEPCEARTESLVDGRARLDL